MDTLDSLLESIAFENFTTSIHVAGLLNGNVKDSNMLTPTNYEINRKTDALNRYFDNLINFNREYEKYRHQSRKSDSPSDQSSELSDQQSHNNVRRSTQVKKLIIVTQLNRKWQFYIQLLTYMMKTFSFRAKINFLSPSSSPYIFIVNVFSPFSHSSSISEISWLWTLRSPWNWNFLFIFFFFSDSPKHFWLYFLSRALLMMPKKLYLKLVHENDSHAAIDHIE